MISTSVTERLDMIQRNDGERIGQYAQRLMLSSDMKNPEILNAVRAAFPEAKTTLACIAWYRSDIKKQAKTAPAPTPAERTKELIAAEIEDCKQLLLTLEEELEAVTEEETAKLLAEEAELMERLEKIKAAKAAKEATTQE